MTNLKKMNYLWPLLVVILLINERGIKSESLWSKSVKKNISEKKARLRSLTLTTLYIVYPTSVFKSTNPVNLQLTFNEAYVAGEVTSVYLVDGSGTQIQISVGSAKNGILEVSLAQAIGTTGTYTFSITNSAGSSVTTSGVTLTVQNDPQILFDSITSKICWNTAFNVAVTLDENLDSNQIKSASLTDNSNAASPLTVSLTVNTSQGNQLSFSSTGTTDESSNYSFDIVTTGGVTVGAVSSLPKIQIGNGYAVNSLTSSTFSANCAIQTSLVFNKAISNINTIASVSMATIGNFDSFVIDPSDDTKLNVVLSAGYGTAGTYAITVTDDCSKTITAPSITINPPLTYSSNTPTLYETNKAISIDITFASAVTHGEVASVSLSDGTNSYQATSITINNSDNTIVTVTFNAIATAYDYTATITDWCTKTQTFNFRIVDPPSITGLTSNCFAKNSAISTVVQFANDVIYSTEIQNTATCDGVTFTQSTFDTHSVTFASPSTGISTAGDYSISLTTIGGTALNSGTYTLKIFDTMTPTLDFTPKIWNSNTAYTITVTSQETLNSGEYTGLAYSNSGNFNNFAQVGIVTGFTADVTSLTAGTYSPYLIDACSNSYTLESNLVIVDQPTITSFTPKCFVANAAYTTTVTFSASIYPDQMSGFQIGSFTEETTIQTFTTGTQSTLQLHGIGRAVGAYSLNVIDITKSAITAADKLTFLAQLISVSDFTPKVWETNKQIALTVTFNQQMTTSDITASTFLDSNGNTASTITFNSVDANNNSALDGTTTLTAAGAYTMSLTDFCNYPIKPSTTIQILDVPSVTNIAPLCFGTSASIDTTITFDKTVVSGYLKPVTIGNASTTAQTMTFGNISGTTVEVILNAGIPTSAVYDLTITSVAGTSIPTTKQIRIGNYGNPATISTYTPVVYDLNKAITLTFTMSRSMQDGEITDIWVQQAGGQQIAGTITSINQSTVVASVPAITAAGDYTVSLIDWCGNTIKGSDITIVTPPTITAISPACYLENSAITTDVTFSALIANELASVSAKGPSGITSMTLGTRNNNIQTVTLAAPGLSLGSYTLSFTDSTGESIGSSDKLLVVSTIQPLVLNSFSPLNVYSGKQVTLQAVFASELLDGQITSVTLTDGTATVESSSIAVSGNSASIVFSSVTSAGVYTLSGKDACGNSFTSKIQLTAIDKPVITSFTSVCAVADIAFDITLNLQSALTQNEISQIEMQSTTSASQLTLKTFQGSSSSLSLSSNGLSTGGNYLAVITDFTGGSTQSQQQFLVLTSSDIPSSILSVSPMSFASTAGIYITITFDKQITSASYISYVTLTNTAGNAQEVKVLSSGTDYIEVTLNNFEFNDNSYTVKVGICNSVLVGPSVTITNVPPASGGNAGGNTGSSAIGSDYVDKNGCKVGTTYNSSTRQCVSCQVNNQFYYNDACVNACPADTFIYNDYICTTNCSNFNFVTYQGKCVGVCPTGYVPGDNGNCINCVNLGKYYLGENCVDVCPTTYYLNELTSTCNRYINIFEGHKYTCADDPCNGGQCSMVYQDQIQCKCPSNQTGMLCEKYTNTVNVNLMQSLIDTIVSTSDPTNDTYQLTNTASNLLENFPAQVYTASNADKMFSYTKNQLTNMLNGSQTSNVNVLKFVNLSIDFKNKQLEDLESQFSAKLGSQTRLLAETNSAATLYLQDVANYLIMKPQIHQNIKDLLTQTNSYVTNFVQNETFDSVDSSIIFGSSYVTVQIALNNESSLKDFKQAALDNGLIPVDASACISTIVAEKNLAKETSLILTKIEYSYKLNQFLQTDPNVNPNLSSNIIFFDIYDFTSRAKVDMSICKTSNNPIEIEFPFNPNQGSSISMPDYLKYKALGVDIYYADDIAFNTRCFNFGDYYNYDTTENYRRFNIFQNLTISCTGGDCQYTGFSDDLKHINCQCGNIDDNTGVSSQLTDYIFPKASDINLEVVNCPHMGFNEKIYRNAGFWVSLVAIVAFISAILIHPGVFKLIVENDDMRYGALKFDGIISDKDNEEIQMVDCEYAHPKEVAAANKDGRIYLETEDNMNMNMNLNNNKETEKANDKKENKDRHIRMGSEEQLNIHRTATATTGEAHYQSFWQIYFKLLFEDHPVFSLFNHSIICPFGLKITLFFFKLFMYFSINAFIFTDSYIETRIYHVDRYKFAYPMYMEFSKIIATIVILSLVLIIIRFISLPWPKYKKRLIKECREASTPQEEVAACYNFYNKLFVRFSITITVIGVLFAFFFYYNIVFIGVYPQLFAGWLYSAVWCMILIWVVFSPFVILILSLVEYFGQTFKWVEICGIWTTYPLKFMF